MAMIPAYLFIFEEQKTMSLTAEVLAGILDKGNGRQYVRADAIKLGISARQAKGIVTLARGLRARNLALPRQYGECKSSLECAICPAFHGLSDRRITAMLSQPLARCADQLGQALRIAAFATLRSIDAANAEVPGEDRPARWAAARAVIIQAVRYDTSGKTIEEIGAGYLSGLYELFTTDGSALLIEIVEHPIGKMIHLYLGAGRLAELMDDLFLQAELYGKLHGCHAAIIGGR
jgi:hypothetical protein